MRMTYVRAAALGVAVLAAGGSTQGARPQAVGAALDGYLRETVKEGEPGMALCVMREGKTVYLKAAGLANVQSGAALRTDTPIYLASLGKEFTTAAVLRLVEQKKLGLDDPIASRLPGLPSYMASVTVRHLLTHTSGVPDYLDQTQEKVSGWTNQDVLDFLGRQTALSFPAGSKWSYCNSGFVLLAEMAGRVAGLPFARLLEQEFFRPLGMTSTYVRQKGRDEAEHAIGYEMKEGAWQVSDYDNYTAGSGGIYASVEDMCRWGRALDDGSVLARMTLIAAFTPAVTSSARPTPMGLGFQVEDVAAGPLQGTWYAAMFGIYRGFRGVDMKMKDRPWRYVVLSNSGRAPEPMQIPNLMAEP